MADLTEKSSSDSLFSTISRTDRSIEREGNGGWIYTNNDIVQNTFTPHTHGLICRLNNNKTVQQMHTKFEKRMSMKKLIIRREAFAAYERRAGFPGLGDFFVRKGLLEYEEENTEQHMPLPRHGSTKTQDGERVQTTVIAPEDIKVSSLTR